MDWFPWWLRRFGSPPLGRVGLAHAGRGSRCAQVWMPFRESRDPRCLDRTSRLQSERAGARAGTVVQESDRVGAKVAHARRAGSPACERQREHGQRLRKGGPGVWPRPVWRKPAGAPGGQERPGQDHPIGRGFLGRKGTQPSQRRFDCGGRRESRRGCGVCDPAVAQVRRARMGG